MRGIFFIFVKIIIQFLNISIDFFIYMCYNINSY